MKLLRYLLYLLTGALALTACSSYEIDYRVYDAPAADSIYVELTLDLSGSAATPATRANPTGGEQGDGWEYGSASENAINDFTLFVLNGYDVNSAASARFAAQRYFSPEDVATATTMKENVHGKDVFSYVFSIPVPTGQDAETLIENESLLRQLHFFVAANVGNLTTAGIATLGELRDYLPTRTFTPATSTTPASGFAMSNERDVFYSTGSGSTDDPVRLHVTIERMAARIDFLREGYSKVDGNSLVYDIHDEADADKTLASIYLDDLTIVNGCRKPSFLIKRVANDIEGTAGLTYLGDERATADGVQTNYVIDPYSTLKTAANRTNTALLGELYADVEPHVALDPTADNLTLGYVNENTFDRTNTFAEYTTGVQLRCRFVPLHDYYTDYDAETDALTAGTYTTPGQTFYMVEPNQPDITEADRRYFASKTAAEAYAQNTAKGHFGRVVEFTGGVCYYYVYMRHSNKVEVVHNTMEFGIVRNNIYRFSLLPATGPGTPTADPRHPEELRARIYVRKWRLVEHPVILV